MSNDRPEGNDLDSAHRAADALLSLGSVPDSIEFLADNEVVAPVIEFIEPDGAFSYQVTEQLPNGRVYSYRAVIDPSNAGPIVTGLVITAPQGIDSSVLRAIKPAELVLLIGNAAERAVRQWVETLDTEQGRRAREALHELDGRAPRRGTRPLSPEFLRDVAEEYLRTEEEFQGTRTSVIGTIAERRGKSQKTVEMWVRRAAKAGFLSAATPGRAGRMAGPRFYESSTKEHNE